MIGFQCNRHIFTKIVTDVRVLGKLQKARLSLAKLNISRLCLPITLPT
jgi:hypothetical protein